MAARMGALISGLAHLHLAVEITFLQVWPA